MHDDETQRDLDLDRHAQWCNDNPIEEWPPLTAADLVSIALLCGEVP